MALLNKDRAYNPVMVEVRPDGTRIWTYTYVDPVYLGRQEARRR